MNEYIKREYAVDAVLDVYCDTPEIDLSCEKFEAAIRKIQAADVAQVRHGRWILEAHDERVNYRWNVTAECSECCDEEKEIWAGFFPNVPPPYCQRCGTGKRRKREVKQLLPQLRRTDGLKVRRSNKQ